MEIKEANNCQIIETNYGTVTYGGNQGRTQVEQDVREAISKLAQAVDADGNPLFTDQAQWWAVYKVLTDRMDFPNKMTQFCAVIADMQLPEGLLPPCKYESLRKVAPITCNLGLWQSRLATAPETQRKQMAVGLRLIENLGIQP